MIFSMGEVTPFLDIAYDRSGLTNSEINSLVDYFKQSNHQDASVGSGIGVHDENIRKSEVVWMDHEFANKFGANDIIQKIYQRVDYLNSVLFKFDLFDIEPMQITRYDQSNRGFYEPHYDCTVQQSNITRKLSFVIQLSDPSEFEGGEFIYHTHKEEINFSKQYPEGIQKGSILLFPSFMAHGVTPVTKGTRYSLVGWCIGERFK